MNKTLVKTNKRTLDRASKMSKSQLNKEIDKRLRAIQNNEVQGEHLEALKIEASEFAKILLRRN